MNDLELQFRRQLIAEMSGVWYSTIHVESHLNPGVPDLSYVMISREPNYETGWLELKAIHETKKSLQFTLEPSQHRWIEKHHRLVPVHFLLAVDRIRYLVCGSHHDRFSTSITHEELRQCSITWFESKDTRRVLHDTLKTLTKRG